MYCTNCGREITSKGKFCMFCGSKFETVSELLDKHDGVRPANEISVTKVDTKTKDVLKEKIQKNITEYLNEMKIYNPMTVNQYFNFNLLKKVRLICWIVPPVVGLLFGPVGIFFGVFAAVASYMFYSGTKLVKENNRIRNYKHHEGVIEDIFRYIQEHSEQYPEIECKTFYDDHIDIGFKGQTIHKIVFDEDRNTYKIKCKKCQLKSVLKNGGKSSSALMYKNAKLLNPVLSAMVDCAIQR